MLGPYTLGRLLLAIEEMVVIDESSFSMPNCDTIKGYILKLELSKLLSGLLTFELSMVLMLVRV
jgi:hypothetical protein